MPEASEQVARPKTSTRDHAELHRQIVGWLSGLVTDPSVSALVVPEGNGMSSETLIFEAEWTEGAGHRLQRCAARLRPDPAALPVFAVYDLEKQFRVMQLVATHSSVPVPRTLWFEPDERHIGSPFIVMECVDGEVPPDVMPYSFGSWLSEAPESDQRRLQDASVRVLGDLHTMDVTEDELSFLASPRPGETALRRHVADAVAYYEWVAAAGVRSPLIERCFGWLEDHRPAGIDDSGLSWGDARIGNMMFRDFEPVAVLDWEMASLGPVEIDLSWMIYLHRVFEDLAVQLGLPGMPGFMRRDDVAATYEQATGRAPRDLDWFTLYAALRHGVIMSRVTQRSILFGEQEMPDDPDDLIMHRTTLQEMLDGTYWSRI
jgi:aminoglycoside phosphotransferase (APT) family kinase protein